MDKSPLPKDKAVVDVHPVHPLIEGLHSEIKRQRVDLKRAREQVVDDEEALQVAIARKRSIETHLNHTRGFAHSIERDIDAAIGKCSATLLKPLLDMLQKKLPLELREMVYENLVDLTSPIVIPKEENSTDIIKNSTQISENHDPFQKVAAFDSDIMGPQIAHETRELTMRKTLICLRGAQCIDPIAALTSTRVSPGKSVRDAIRHLRVYLRCETFEKDLSEHLAKVSPLFEPEEEQRRHAEPRMYASYSRRLKRLEELPYNEHKIKVEICILHEFFERHNFDERVDSSQTRKLLNLMEAVKPTYFHLKDAGAEVSIRCENFHAARGSDMTWAFDLDEKAWKERKGPSYVLDEKEQPPSRKIWVEQINAARQNQFSYESTVDTSWKHLLFEGTFGSCPCTLCKAAGPFHCSYASGSNDFDLGLGFGDESALQSFDFDSFLQGTNGDGVFQFHGDFDFGAVAEGSAL